MRCTVLFLSIFCWILGGCEVTEIELVPAGEVRIDQAPSDHDPDSESTRMCVNANGEVFIIWIDDRTDQDAIWFNRSLDGGSTWLPAAVKVNRGDGNVWAPDIDCTNQGIYVVWEDDRDGDIESHNIYFNRSLNGGETWEDEDRLLERDEDGLSMSLGPRIAADGSDIYVAYYDSQYGAYDIFVAASDNQGDDWLDPIRVDSADQGESYSAKPQLVAAGNGRVFVAWEDSRDGDSDIYFARSTDGAISFRTDVRLDGGDEVGSHDSFAPSMSTDGSSIYVVWHDERDGEFRDVFMNYSADAGETWQQDAIRVDSDSAGFFNSLYPNVAVHDGEAHIVWEDARNGGYDVYYRKAVDGVFAEEEIRLDRDPDGYANSLGTRVEADTSGVIVAWEDGRNDAEGQGYNDLFYNYFGVGEWSAADLRLDSLADGTSYKVDLNVAMFEQQIYYAWTDGRNGTSDVYFHRLEMGDQAQAFVAIISE